MRNILLTALAYLLWFGGIGRLPAYQISFLGLFSPVMVVVLGFLVLDQGFGLRQSLGIGLILASVSAAQTAGHIAGRLARYRARRPICTNRCLNSLWESIR